MVAWVLGRAMLVVDCGCEVLGCDVVIFPMSPCPPAGMISTDSKSPNTMALAGLSFISMVPKKSARSILTVLAISSVSSGFPSGMSLASQYSALIVDVTSVTFLAINLGDLTETSAVPFTMLTVNPPVDGRS